MQYYEVVITSSFPYAYDILTAALADIGFESFSDEEDVLKAYIQEQHYDSALLQNILQEYQPNFGFSYKVNTVETRNWNAIWEENFQPISIPGKLHVRALFHTPDPSYPLEIVIQPKMSFGTGHHATTYQVMDLMLGHNFQAKKVMDFGTGTGILAILAKKLGAAEVWAVDNDPQCIENASENFEINHTPGIHLQLGDINTSGNEVYDIIIGNITRNIILEFLPSIAAMLAKNGLFIASGFYEADLPMLKEQAAAAGIVLQSHTVKDSWCAALFKKEYDA